ncbi:WYL domain-containing protein [Klebsiella pneumoniae]|uniref:WYL domain-containing protein n=2 Tax=Klebsiella pneumoniae TaxID=573 RepID=UPI002FEF6D0F
MDTIIPIFFVGLAVYSMITYFKSPEKLAMRVAKGVAAFLASIAAFGAFLGGDYALSLPVALIVLFLTIRQLKTSKTLSSVTHQPTSFSAPKEPIRKHNPDGEFRKISFEYTDSNGTSTHREVDVKEITEQHITGYCHSRRQLRTFRLDRIDNSEIVVRNTGELINVYDWIVQLYGE